MIALSCQELQYEHILFQLTEEKLGTSEKTELDANFENLVERSDTTKVWTEKILKNTEAVLTPNPGMCVVVFSYLRNALVIKPFTRWNC